MADETQTLPAPVPGTITAQPNAPVNTAEKLLVQIVGDLATAVKAIRP